MQRNRGHNRMRNTRDVFNKIRDTEGAFFAKMGTIKDRNGMDLTEAEDIKRGGKNTQKNCTKKISMTQITTMRNHSPRARHAGMRSQVGLRKHHYEQS